MTPIIIIFLVMIVYNIIALTFAFLMLLVQFFWQNTQRASNWLIPQNEDYRGNHRCLSSLNDQTEKDKSYELLLR